MYTESSEIMVWRQNTFFILQFKNKFINKQYHFQSSVQIYDKLISKNVREVWIIDELFRE